MSEMDVPESVDLDKEPYLDFDPPLEKPGDPLEAAALAFHQKNPHVLREIAKVCLRLRRSGRRRWSMKAAFEVVRYNAAITTDHRTYKLNNNHTAWFSRWLMRDYAELKGFFVTREQGRIEQAYGE